MRDQDTEEGEKDGGREKKQRAGEKEIGYAEIQATNLMISIALLMTVFDTPVGQAYKIRCCHHSHDHC